MQIKNILGKTVWVIPASGKGKPICGTAFAQGPRCTWWVMQKDGDILCVPQGDLILGENSQWTEWYDVNCYIILYVITFMVAICCINGISVRVTQINEEWTFMKPSKVQQWWNQNWFQHATIQHHTPSLLPWKTVMTDGAQSHGLNELNGHFRGMAHRPREWYLCVYIKRQGKWWWLIGIYWKVWDLGMT